MVIYHSKKKKSLEPYDLRNYCSVLPWQRNSLRVSVYVSIYIFLKINSGSASLFVSLSP